MWSVVLITACLAAPPLDSVEDLPKLLGEEFDLLQALDNLDEDRRRQEKRLTENQTKRIEVIARRDRAAKRHTELVKLWRPSGTVHGEFRCVDLKKVRQWQLIASSGDYKRICACGVCWAVSEGDEEQLKIPWRQAYPQLNGA